jgi:hypothetical protein
VGGAPGRLRPKSVTGSRVACRPPGWNLLVLATKTTEPEAETRVLLELHAPEIATGKWPGRRAERQCACSAETSGCLREQELQTQRTEYKHRIVVLVRTYCMCLSPHVARSPCPCSFDTSIGRSLNAAAAHA